MSAPDRRPLGPALPSDPLVIACLAGGLGNQMFQYATARRLAIARRAELALDLSGYGKHGDSQAAGLEAFRRQVRVTEFNLAARIATPVEVRRLRDPHFGVGATRSRIVRRIRRMWPRFQWPATHFHEKQYRFDTEVMSLDVPCYLTGFFQSEKYFAEVRPALLTELTPRNPAVAGYAGAYVQRLRDAGNPVVSVHVRRGELAVAQEKLKTTKGVFGPPTGPEYLRRAMSRFDPGWTFLVFSDTPADIAWCKENIRGENVKFCEGHDDIHDMMIMSSCDHHVIASTFSWWAAWLNPGHPHVVAPSQWGHPGGPMVTDDLIPARWEMA